MTVSRSLSRRAALGGILIGLASWLLLAGLGVVGMRTALQRRRGARPSAH